MKGNEKAIFSGIALFVLALGFYMFVLSPKRAEVSDLDQEITSLRSSIDEQQQLVSFGEQARKEFPKDYGHLVVLGKAVPDQADTASLMVQLNSIANSSDVQFRGIALNEGASGAGSNTAAATAIAGAQAPSGETATSTDTTSTESSSGDTSTTSSTSTTTAAPATAPATEAAAANLPIGAVVGSAGLPTLPYKLTFAGGFFGIADYIAGVDDLVQFQDDSENVEVDGRLMTIDGFALSPIGTGPNPPLDATFMLTSYVTPSTQGLTAGASPTGPASAGVASAGLASSTTTP